MIIDLIFWLLALTVAITVHEAAHAWMADRLGDPTSRLMGRLTLNPLKHYDPVGTSMLLLTTLMRVFGLPVIPFGWAKPVMFDPYNLKDPKKGAALVSLAGPGANILLSIVISLAIRLTGNSLSLGYFLLVPMITLNVALAIFNLIPIRPLDGEKILLGLLPQKDAAEFEAFMRRYGTLMLFGLIIPTVNGQSLISLAISPVISFFIRLLI